MIDGVDMIENTTSTSSKITLKVEKGQGVSPTEDTEVVNLNRPWKRRKVCRPPGHLVRFAKPYEARVLQSS